MAHPAVRERLRPPGRPPPLPLEGARRRPALSSSRQTPHPTPLTPPSPVPSSRQLGVICEHFLRGAPPAAQRKLLLRVEELSLVTALNEVVAAHQTVHFGSYPRDGSDDGVLTIITLEAPDEAELDAAVDALLATLPPDAVARVSSADEPFDSPPTSPVMQPATKAAPPPAAV